MNEVINAFPGYEYVPFKNGKGPFNMYRGIDLKFGGYVYSEPGIHLDVALLDIQSQHPNSAVNMNCFGEYTKKFKDLLDARIAIKNGELEKLENLFDGRLMKYVGDSSLADQLATALKISINSVYGLTSARFSNPFRDPRNVNNIVALRGALFMKTLQDEIVAKGYRVAGIRTDSIKIPNADNAIIAFCMDFAKKYGYSFQHEATYDRMCLVDKANYIAAYKRPEECEELYGYIPKDNLKHFKKNNHPWTATGEAFQSNYIFKTLFSGEPIVFDDLCETKSVTGGAIYLDMNEKLPDVSDAEEELSRRKYNEGRVYKLKKLSPEYESLSDEELSEYIAEGHNYIYVGRVGLFTPVKKGLGGGFLVREKDGKYSSVTGTKGYRWLESENVVDAGKQGDVDYQFYEDAVGEAIKAINEFGDFERFIDVSKPYIPPEPEVKEEPKAKDISPTEAEDDDPPWSDLPPVVPCGDGKYNTCLECPHCLGDTCDAGYSLCVYQNMEVHDP